MRRSCLHELGLAGGEEGLVFLVDLGLDEGDVGGGLGEELEAAGDELEVVGGEDGEVAGHVRIS